MIYYILEGRKRLEPDSYIPNNATGVITIFTKVKDAEKWIKDNQDYWPAKTVKKGKRFYCLLSCTVGTDDVFFKDFYKLDGTKIKLNE